MNAHVSEFVSVVVSDGSQDAGLAMLHLSRPPTNAMTRQVYREIVTAAAELGSRDDVAAVILFGGHEIFSAGDDMPELRTLTAPEAETAARVRQDAIDAVAAIPKPTVAAITGYALGAGLTLALAADWRVSGDNVKFGATEILAGLIPGGGGLERLTRVTGASRAKELVFSGRFVDAEEALALGLIDEMVAPTTCTTLPRGSPAASSMARDMPWPPPKPASTTSSWGRRPSVSRPSAAATPKCSPQVRAAANSGIRAAVRLPCMTDATPAARVTADQVEAARHDTKLAQVLYHDWEAETYDEKWSISYDQRCVDYARGRFDAVVPDGVLHDLPYDRALELGCGTGFFLLNLIQSGVARRGSVTDLSPGMVKVATRNGQSLGLDIDGRVADAEGIPYEDNTFDLVVGHAVLHHIPDVELSLREVIRVLKPGGRFVFAGEPTNVGEVYARSLSTLTWRVATNVTKLPGLGGWRRPQVELDESSRVAALEAIVDLHTFAPEDLERMAANAGAVQVETSSEEFTAAMFGWPVRTFEASVPPGRLGWGWAKFAFNGWKTLSWVDANVWRRLAPKGWFYNVMVTGVKPS